jgi:hypothetical protein
VHAWRTRYSTYDTQHPKRNCLGALFHAIWNAGHSIDAEVILLDLSPALGLTNQVTILHADYFLVPCEVNKLSEKNLRSMGPLIESWYKTYQHGGMAGGSRIGYRDVTRGLTNNLFPVRTAELPLPDIAPQFLGIVLSKYDIARRAAKHDSEGYEIVHGGLEETFLSGARRLQAGRLVEAARLLHEHLNPAPGISFAIDNAIFTAPGPGLGEYRHPFKSEHHPQPLVLARVAKGTQVFEAAASVVGKPLSATDESDLEDPRLRMFFKSSSQVHPTYESAEHYRRVFVDLAKFIHHTVPQPPPYNFVFDPKAGGGGGGPAALPALPGIVSRPGGVGPAFGQYPTVDSFAAVDARRTAPVWI